MRNKLQFIFLMDPYETLNLETETSLLLMDELIKRGIRVTWVQQEDLSLLDGRLFGHARDVQNIKPFRLGPALMESLDGFDALLTRIDPPVNTGYLQVTQILDFLSPHVVQFNPAHALRTFNEKLIPLLWPQFTPPTLVSRDIEELAAFFARHRDIVIKPLNQCSGRGIRRLEQQNGSDARRQLQQLLGETRATAGFLLAQKFLPGVKKGDKRIFLLNGEPIGAVNRIPKDPHSLANIHQGAICEATSLTGRELQVLHSVGPFLRRENIMLAGADFIDGYLTEVNITSPSALRQINAVTGASLETVIVDALLDRIASVRSQQVGMSA